MKLRFTDAVLLLEADLRLKEVRIYMPVFQTSENATALSIGT